jgi:hypothetical protein
VEPAAKADQHASAAEDVLDPVQQPAPAAQRPGVGKVGDRLLHQRPQPSLQPVERALPVGEPILGPAVPTGACQCSRGLASPRNPRSSRLATPAASSTSPNPDSSMSSCSWQLPGQPPSHHSRSPRLVDTTTPWAVWACRLASNSTFWLAHRAGRCTRVASPSTTTASPTSAISASHWRRSSRLVMKVPPGWQYPSAASLGSSRSRLSPTSVLEMPTARPARRYDSPSRTTAGVAGGLRGRGGRRRGRPPSPRTFPRD